MRLAEPDIPTRLEVEIPTSDGARVNRKMKPLIRSGKFLFRWQVFMKESGEPSRMLGVNVDVNEHKLAEQELARANERLHLAIDSGSVGGWDFDLKTGGNVWFGK